MTKFKLLQECEILGKLSSAQRSRLIKFQQYLTSIRHPFHGDTHITLGETYNTAWRLGFVDFGKNEMPNLYNIDFNEKSAQYDKLCRIGLDGKAQIEWLMTFNGEIELPTHPSFWKK